MPVSDQLPTDRFPLEKSEAEHLRERRGKPYSLGHRRCYVGPAELIGQGERPVHVVEFGSGIGWGYEQIADRVSLASYLGIERHADSVAVHRAALRRPEHRIVHGTIVPSADAHVPPGEFDYAFCIEVAEHIRAEFHPHLFFGLARALKSGGVLFLSTPDAAVHKHGNLTVAAAKYALHAAGFSSVVSIAEHWTTLYVAQK